MTSPYAIWPRDTGSAVRTFALAREFAERGWEVAALSPGKTETETQSGIRLMGFHSRRSWEHFWNPDFNRALEREMIRNRPDVIVAAYPHQSIMLTRMAKSFGVPLVYDAHNLEQRRVRGTHGVLASRLVRYFENKMVRTSDEVWTVSELEAQNLKAAYSTECLVVPNGVNLSDFPVEEADGALRSELGLVGEPVFGFCGNLRYRPNQEALSFLIDEVWGALGRRGLKPTLLVVGPGRERGWVNEQICFTGAVADIHRYLNLCSWWLAPLFNGGGTRLKILEALACEKRVLATEKAVEGLRVGEREGVVTVSHQRYAAALGKILKSGAAWQPNRSGREFVSRYTWKEWTPKLEAIYHHSYSR